MDKTCLRLFVLKKRLIFILVPFFVVLCGEITAKSFVKSASSKEVKFIYPLDVPMSLSGNYGELRGIYTHTYQ